MRNNLRPTRQPNVRRWLTCGMYGCLSLFLTLLLIRPATATEADTNPAPFLATYATTLNGMPLGIDLRLRLTAADNNWLLALEANSRMMRYTESSLFRWTECRAEPIRYRYEFDGFGVDRKLWLDFDYGKKIANGESRRGPVSYAFPLDVTDELGLAYAARCQLMRGASQATYNVATTNGMKALTYTVEKPEVLKTPWGKIDAIRVVRARQQNEKRRSTIWIAPSLGYIMVKMEHVEKLGVRGSATLKALEGITPSAAAPPSGKASNK